MLAALTAGASLGFLFHNRYPARVFMGDSGANLLGYLLGVVAVIGSLKTGAVVALAVPLMILAVPFLDTGFVVAKRLKYRPQALVGRCQPLPPPDGSDRFLATEDGGVSLRLDADAGGGGGRASVRALLRPSRPLPPRLVAGDGRRSGWSRGGHASTSSRARDLQVPGPSRARVADRDPDTSEHEIDQQVQRDIETGEFDRVG